MIISNFKNLARNPLRKKALLIAEAGYEAINIKKVIEKEIKLDKKTLSIKGRKFYLDGFSRIFLIGLGKGSALACVSLARILDRRLTKGIALDIQSPHGFTRIGTRINTDKKLEFLVGTHPLPSIKNVIATKKIIELAKSADENDLIITFICGGGSSLLCSSEEELNDSVLATKELTKAGADIIELNTVRKHLSGIKAGGLAKIAYPTTIISLIVSDVLGNDLSMVASGPTVYDKTTKNDAEKILKKHGLNPKKFHLIETPKNKKYFKKACPVPKQGFWCGVKNILFLSNREPILAMAEKAKKLGFKPKIYSLKIMGEAKNALLPLMEAAKNNQVLLAAGETTVVLRQQATRDKRQEWGRGGRNMEAVLGLISNFQFPISNDLLVLSIASDGRDNTEAAGAITDHSTIEKIEKLKLNAQKFLDNHDSFNFFKKTDDLIFTEPKTFNVSDLMLILK